MISEISTREAYGKTLEELGRTNPNIVVLDADLSKSTMTQYFAKEFPDRFFNCGRDYEPGFHSYVSWG